MTRADDIRDEMRDKGHNVKREIPISFNEAETPEETVNEESSKSAQIELAADQGDRQQDPTATDDPVEVNAPRQDSIARLQTRLNELTVEKASLYDRLVRQQAEFENYRKRVERDRAGIYQHGRDDVLLQFLPVVDNFERALSSLETSDGDAESLRHGVELIHKQFKDALSKFGLEPVEAVGQTFDPHVHEAVTTEPSDKHEENTVIEEFQRGYKIGNRLLRPAKVKVASSPEK